MSIQKLFITACLTIGISSHAQEAYRITYEKINHDKKVDEANPIQVLADNTISIIGTVESLNKPTNSPTEYLVYDRNQPDNLIQIFQQKPTHVIHTIDSVKWNKITFEKKNETKRILGLRVKKAVAHINSNTIDLWYVDNLGIHASPTSIGIPLGFVMEFTRNNTYTIRANKIERIQHSLNEFPALIAIDDQLPMDGLTYKDHLWRSKFTEISLFENKQINFTKDPVSNDSVFSYAHGTIAVRKIKLPKIDRGNQVFLSVEQQSNGDAYDRTGSVFLIPKANKEAFLTALKNGPKTLPIYQNGNGKSYQGMHATKDFSPFIELMRFFTPFGIQHFNHIEQKNVSWQNKAHYRQDISEFSSLLTDEEVLIGLFIGNYDQGGHRVSAKLSIHPNPSQLMGGDKVMTLFNTSNPLEMIGQEYGTLFDNAKGMMVEFELKEDWNNAKLRYTTTGHGGWSNGDEFVPKENRVFLDNQLVFSVIPWRQDCGSYRSYNPASGNFDNGLSSSDYSRSNWCPGTITNPYYIELGNLKAGKHQMQVKIPQGEAEAGSFSFWAVSGTLLAD